jgi:hypothetical protein
VKIIFGIIWYFIIFFGGCILLSAPYASYELIVGVVDDDTISSIVTGYLFLAIPITGFLAYNGLLPGTEDALFLGPSLNVFKRISIGFLWFLLAYVTLLLGAFLIQLAYYSIVETEENLISERMFGILLLLSYAIIGFLTYKEKLPGTKSKTRT